MTPRGRIAAWGSGVIALLLVSGAVLAQQYPTRGRFGAVGGGDASTTGTSLTLAPGPLAVGAGGISTDGGVTITGGTLRVYGTDAIRLVEATGRITSNDGAGNYMYNDGATGLWRSSSGWSANGGTGTTAFAVIQNGARVDFGAGASDYASSDGTSVTFAGPIRSASTLTVGTITLAAGTGTATVTSGAICACTDTTANTSVRCAVATTTLTATGTASDVIAYVCL